MGSKQDRGATITQRTEQPAHLLDAAAVEAVHGLVQDQQRRMLHDGLGNTKALAHTEGVFPNPLFVCVVQAHRADGGANFLRSNLLPDRRQVL